jgi:hypothetical protein
MITFLFSLSVQSPKNVQYGDEVCDELLDRISTKHKRGRCALRVLAPKLTGLKQEEA